jgi:hypothetical protein
MRINIIGGVFIFIGLCVGVIGAIAIFTSDGSLLCIISIMAMLCGVLLLQLAQQQAMAASINDKSNTTE